MLRLVLEATAACGYAIGFLYNVTNFFDLPVAFIGLAWMVTVRFIPHAVPAVVMFWITYALLVFQLISFHDFNACVLNECRTSELYSYIVLGSTGLFWFSMRDKNNTKYEMPKEEPKKPNEPKELPLVEREIFPALKIRIKPDNKTNNPLQLNMGRSLQPKWV